MARAIRETCIAGAVIDRTVKWSRAGEKRHRAPKKNVTTASMRKYNDHLAEKKLARKINANFVPGDYHTTLTYAEVPTQEEAERQLSNWIRRMKREYAKAGKEFRYIAVTEYKNHRIHHHIVMSYIDHRIIQKQWREGRCLFSVLNKSRNYRKLANYLIKETQKTFREPGNATKRRWRGSRNLVEPIVVRQEVSASEFYNDPKPVKGYAIDEDSVIRYENPVNGLEHLEYCMVSTDPVPRLHRWRTGKVVKRSETYLRFDEYRQLELNFDGWETV